MKKKGFAMSIGIAGYILVILLVFGVVLFASSTEMIFGDDIHLTYYFFRQYVSQNISKGIFPWWNPYLFAGQPFAAHPQAFLPFYPLNWLFVLIPVSRAFSWYLALHIVIAMTGMYWMTRRWIGSIPAWSAGMVFGLSGYFMARMWAGHVDVIAASAWVPWVFGAYMLAIQKGSARFIVVAGFVLTLQLLVGYQSVAVFTMEAVGIAMVFLMIKEKSLRPLLRVIGAIIIALGFAAVALLPVQQFAKLSIRSFSLPYDWASGFGLNINMLKLLIHPFVFGDQRSYIGQWPNLGEYLMFIGRIPLVLAVTYVCSMVWRKEKQMRGVMFIGIVFFSLWVSFGGNAPVDLLKILWTVFPPYHFFRLPSRHLILFVFAASALTGLALNYIKSKSLQAVLTVAIAIELVLFARGFIETKPIPETHHDERLVQMLQTDDSLYRILPNFGVWLSPRESLDFDSAMTYKIFSVTGYDPSIVRNYYEFIDAANGKTSTSVLEHNVQIPYLDASPRIIDYLNVKYLFVPTWADQLDGKSTQRFSLVMEDLKRGYRLYENRSVLPRFYFVPNARVFINREEQQLAIIRGELMPESHVFVTGEISKSNAPDGCIRDENRVKVTSYTPNRIKLTTQSRCDNYLVSSEVMYPGWEVYVDGEKAQLIEGNMAFRTLFVPQGNHTVEMVFVPRIFILGAIISVGTIILSLFLL